MAFHLSRHATRDDATTLQFRRRVPLDVVERLRGRSVTVTLPATTRDAEAVVSFKLGTHAKVSLRTGDKGAADVRALHLAAHLSKIYEAARNGPVTLSQRQLVALAGEVYGHLISEHGDNPGTEAEWATFKAITRAAVEGRISGAPAIPLRGRSDDAVMRDLIFGEGEALTEAVNALPQTKETHALEQRVGRLAVWVLGRNGIEVDPATHLSLLREIARAALQFGWQAKRMAAGDYRPDPDANRFPEFSKQAKAAGLPLSGLFERWKAEAKPAPKTVSTWGGVIRSLTDHLGRDEVVTRISKADVLAWKDAMVARGVQARTVNQSITALRTLLNHGMRNSLVGENVTAGVRVIEKAKAGERMLPYTDADVARLLEHATRETTPARRWLPMLAVLTGARIGELAQAWGGQVCQREGMWVIEIRPAPDGGTLKNAGSERTVPLHPHIVDSGFLDFVREKGNRPLFYGKPARGSGDGTHASKGVSNKLGAWIRSLPGFDDPRKAPAHAARHWFKTKGAQLELMDSLINAIQGHTDSSTAGTYRHFSLDQMRAAIERYSVPAQGVLAERDGAMPVPPAARAEETGSKP